MDRSTFDLVYPGSSLVIILKPFLSPFMLRCPPLWHLGKLRGTSYLPRGHFSNMLVSAMQRLFFDVKLATPTQIRSLWCQKGCLNLHSTMEFWGALHVLYFLAVGSWVTWCFSCWKKELLAKMSNITKWHLFSLKMVLGCRFEWK